MIPASRVDRPTPERTFPLNSWYVAGHSSEVSQRLLGRRMMDLPVLLYRTADGTPVALEDRCAHRAFPLSRGRLDGDRVVCGYHGFEYDGAGRCVRVPSQSHVPFDAGVRSFPVHDDGTFVWIWPGESGLAALRRPPEVPWLADPGWSTVGDQDDVAADYLLLHETFADVTHLPYLGPGVAPPALQEATPPLEVDVTETSVAICRRYAAAPLPAWQSRATAVAPDAEFEQRETGRFIGPGLWLDTWEVFGRGAGGAVQTLRLTQAISPVTATTSGLVWRVSRDFAVDDATIDAVALEAFAAYYANVKAAVETVQEARAAGSTHRDVNVTADVAALHVRKVVRALVAEESGRTGRSRPADLRPTGV